jgi:hypothetical protein
VIGWKNLGTLRKGGKTRRKFSLTSVCLSFGNFTIQTIHPPKDMRTDHVSSSYKLLFPISLFEPLVPIRCR